jgi:peptide subunit release factor 1 (eRF1)
MIRREDIRELADVYSEDGCALSFYSQPSTPQNKSHKEEVIQAKDLVREALREAEKNGKNKCARADLDRILKIAEELHGNQAHAKAIFACSAQGFWHEFELPPQLPGSSLLVNQRFHLRPLAAVLHTLTEACVAVVDRQRARLFQASQNEVSEREDFESPVPRRGRSDGFAGYDAGHAERHVEHEVMHHFKAVAERLKELYDTGMCANLIVGCRDETWPELEPHLHSYVRQHLLGRFSIDTGNARLEQVREETARILSQTEANQRQELIREVLGEAQRNGRGVVGLRRVLQSLETGEVQTLLLGGKFRGAGIECTNCGHLDLHITDACPICGKPTRELSDLSDAIMRAAVRKGVDIVYVEDDPDLDKVGNIGALLRFRADQSTNDLKKAV